MLGDIRSALSRSSANPSVEQDDIGSSGSSSDEEETREDEAEAMRRRIRQLELENHTLIEKLTNERLANLNKGTPLPSASNVVSGGFAGVLKLGGSVLATVGRPVPPSMPFETPPKGSDGGTALENDMLRAQLGSLRQAYEELVRDKHDSGCGCKLDTANSNDREEELGLLRTQLHSVKQAYQELERSKAHVSSWPGPRGNNASELISVALRTPEIEIRTNAPVAAESEAIEAGVLVRELWSEVAQQDVLNQGARVEWAALLPSYTTVLEELRIERANACRVGEALARADEASASTDGRLDVTGSEVKEATQGALRDEECRMLMRERLVEFEERADAEGVKSRREICALESRLAATSASLHESIIHCDQETKAMNDQRGELEVARGLLASFEKVLAGRDKSRETRSDAGAKPGETEEASMIGLREVENWKQRCAVLEEIVEQRTHDEVVANTITLDTYSARHEEEARLMDEQRSELEVISECLVSLEQALEAKDKETSEALELSEMLGVHVNVEKLQRLHLLAPEEIGLAGPDQSSLPIESHVAQDALPGEAKVGQLLLECEARLEYAEGALEEVTSFAEESLQLVLAHTLALEKTAMSTFKQQYSLAQRQVTQAVSSDTGDTKEIGSGITSGRTQLGARMSADLADCHTVVADRVIVDAEAKLAGSADGDMVVVVEESLTDTVAKADEAQSCLATAGQAVCARKRVAPNIASPEEAALAAGATATNAKQALADGFAGTNAANTTAAQMLLNSGQDVSIGTVFVQVAVEPALADAISKAEIAEERLRVLEQTLTSVEEAATKTQPSLMDRQVWPGVASEEQALAASKGRTAYCANMLDYRASVEDQAYVEVVAKADSAECRLVAVEQELSREKREASAVVEALKVASKQALVAEAKRDEVERVMRETEQMLLSAKEEVSQIEASLTIERAAACASEKAAAGSERALAESMARVETATQRAEQALDEGKTEAASIADAIRVAAAEEARTLLAVAMADSERRLSNAIARAEAAQAQAAAAELVLGKAREEAAAQVAIGVAAADKAVADAMDSVAAADSRAAAAEGALIGAKHEAAASATALAEALAKVDAATSRSAASEQALTAAAERAEAHFATTLAASERTIAEEVAKADAAEIRVEAPGQSLVCARDQVLASALEEAMKAKSIVDDQLARLREEVEDLRADLLKCREQRSGLQRRIREGGNGGGVVAALWPLGRGQRSVVDAAGVGGGGMLYMHKIEELEAENARLEHLVHGAAALYIPKIQELEAEVGEAQRELDQALEDQNALRNDLADKGAIIRELLRRSGLTDKPGNPITRLFAFKPRPAGTGPGGGMGDGQATNVPQLTQGEKDRALARLLQEVALLRSMAVGASR